MARRSPAVHQPDYKDPKEPYAFFGLAAYFAQCFEQSLVLILASHELLTNRHQSKFRSLDDLFASLDKKTMGMLIGDLSKCTAISENTTEMLEVVLKQRNYLMHHFFPENILKFWNAAGRREVLDELRELAELFRANDRLLQTIYLALWNKLGISEEAVEAYMEQMIPGYPDVDL